MEDSLPAFWDQMLKRDIWLELSWACWINSCLSNDFRWTARNTEKENRSHCIFPFPKKTLEPRDFSTSVLRHVGLDTSSLLRVWSCILPNICQFLWPLPRAPPPPISSGLFMPVGVGHWGTHLFCFVFSPAPPSTQKAHSWGKKRKRKMYLFFLHSSCLS